MRRLRCRTHSISSDSARRSAAPKAKTPAPAGKAGLPFWFTKSRPWNVFGKASGVLIDFEPTPMIYKSSEGVPKRRRCAGSDFIGNTLPQTRRAEGAAPKGRSGRTGAKQNMYSVYGFGRRLAAQWCCWGRVVEVLATQKVVSKVLKTYQIGCTVKPPGAGAGAGAARRWYHCITIGLPQTRRARATLRPNRLCGRLIGFKEQGARSGGPFPFIEIAKGAIRRVRVLMEVEAPMCPSGPAPVRPHLPPAGFRSSLGYTAAAPVSAPIPACRP